MSSEEIWGESSTGAALDAAFESSVAGMAVLDREARFAAVNPALCRILGRTPEQLIGHRTAEFTHPDDQHLTVTTIGQLVSGVDDGTQARKRFVRPDGSVVHVLRTVTMLRDPRGKRTGMLTQMLDVTGLTEVEAALRQSEARLEALLSQSTELILLVDRSGRISYASPAAERVMGHAPAALVGTDALRYVHPDEAALAAEELGERLAGLPGRSEAPIYRLRNRDGSYRQVEVRLTNAFDDPAIDAAVLHLRDVTDEHDYRRQVEEASSRLEHLVGGAWDVITLLGADGRCRYVSPAITAQLGWAPRDLVGARPFDLAHPDDADARRAFHEVVAHGGRTEPVEYRMRHRDGSWRWVESTAVNRLADSAVAGVVVITRDVSSRRRRAAQQEAVANLSGLAVRGEALDTLAGRAVEAIGEVLGCSRVAVCTASAGGFEVLRASGAPIDGELTVPVGGRAGTMIARALAAGGPVCWDATEGGMPFEGHGELRSGAATVIRGVERPAGVLACYDEAADAFSVDDLSFVEATANVLAAAIRRQHMDEELRRRAASDDLTGLPNRSALRERLVAALDRGVEVAVLLIDADDFKLVNDTLGHAAGDRIVTAVSDRLRRYLRRSDTVGRFGGDEFVVLCEDVSADDAGLVAERLRSVLAVPMELEGRQITMTVSVGYVLGGADADPDDLIARADTAMYAAKQAGKNRVARYDDAMRAKVTERLEVASGLRRAVQRDELRLHYQPVFDVESRELVGAEALLRWQHPSHGLLGPGGFIGYAEESGLILPVGEWVLDHAMRQAAEWSKAGFAGRLAINVSAHQLADADFVGTVCGALERTGANTSNLAIEVTESSLMADVSRAAAVLGQLRALGLHVGMDDFGTGHSSLSYLANLPFDFVKIDRSFISRFDQDRRAAALLETIATLCRSLELPAVAEGVETDAQLAEVERLGILQVQGFLLGRPVPADQFRLGAE